MRKKLKFYLSQINHHAAKRRHGFLRFLSLHHIGQDHATQQQSIPNKQNGLNKPSDNQACIAERHNTPRLQRGFTLLEMLVVIGLLGIVALGATTFIVEDLGFERQEETKVRWDNIRKAIIGEPNLHLNGSPYVAGFVADMGRLPLSISELIEKDPELDDGTACLYNHDDDLGTAEIEISQPDYTAVAIDNYIPDNTLGFTNTVAGGWRGPYLHTAGSHFYGDGWFNPDSGDQCDFDWQVNSAPITEANVFPEITDIQIQSFGSDGAVGGSGASQDYPDDGINMITNNQWKLSVATPINFNINFDKPVSTVIPGLELRIYRYIDDGDETATFDDDIFDASSAIFDLADTDTFAPMQSITPTYDHDVNGATPDLPMPVGPFAAVIWCTTTTPEVVYDGDCDTTTNIKHSPVYFTLTHNTSQVTMTWNLPDAP